MSGILTNNELQKLLGRVPKPHVSNPHLIEIVYVNKTKPDPGDMRKRPAQVMGETEIDEGEQTARIRIFRQKPSGNDDLFDFQDSIYHEVGHVVYYFFLTNAQKLKWHRLHGETQYTWTEAGRDPVEHFAETYANYVLHNEIVKRRYKREHSFLNHEVFSVDYKGGENDEVGGRKTRRNDYR